MTILRDGWLMALIESEIVSVNASVEKVFDFLKDINNFRLLLPEDKLESWEANETDCFFSIKGLPSIRLCLEATVANSSVILVTVDKKPLDMQLTFNLQDNIKKTCDLQVVIDVEINNFMLSMVQKPLENFINMFGVKLNEIMQDNQAG